MSSIVFVYPNLLFACIYSYVFTQCLGALHPHGTNPLSRLVLGWLRQVVMHLRKCHQPLLMYSFSNLNKELTTEGLSWCHILSG